MPGADGGNGGDAGGAAVDSLGALAVSSTTLAGATGTCFAGALGLGGRGGQDGGGFTRAADGSDGSDGSQCGPGGQIAHSGPFSTLGAGEGEPTIPPFPSGGGSSGSGGGNGSGGNGSGGGGGGGGSAAPTSPSASPKPPVIPFVALHAKKLVASGHTVTLNVTCPKGGAACSEKLSLTTTVRVHGAAKARTIKLGSVRLSLAAGRTAKARLKLTKAALSLLKKAHHHRLKATLTLTAAGRTRHRSVTIALPHGRTRR
jgi:hypothetical protein